MRIVTQNDLIHELQSGLKEPNRISIVDYTENQVNYGFDAKPNFEYCKQHNIPCVDIGRRGGAFVVNKGDVGLGAVMKGFTNEVGELISSNFLQYLKDKGLDATYGNNDILINGYKVYGWASHYYKDYDAMFITCHFTMSVNIDLIKAICTKPMNKVPKGLSEYGITQQEIKDLIIRVCENV